MEKSDTKLNLFNNIFYYLGVWLKTFPAGIFFILISVPIRIFMIYQTILIPKTIILGIETGTEAKPILLSILTAGLLITAKNSAAAAVWTKLISSHLVTKRYCALCTGTFASHKGRIDDPVVHKGNAKEAETFFSLRRQADIEAGGMRLCFSLVDLTLGTGRMHQIRIHLAGQKTPIAGDDKYGDFKLNRFLRKTFGIKKMHLAALRLDFSEQCIGSAFVPPYLEAPFPDFMSETLVRLGFGT